VGDQFISANSTPPIVANTSVGATSDSYLFSSAGDFYIRACADNNEFWEDAIDE
jgi:hypothetical protein